MKEKWLANRSIYHVKGDVERVGLKDENALVQRRGENVLRKIVILFFDNTPKQVVLDFVMRTHL